MTEPTYRTVAELLAEPDRWCQVAYAEDAHGEKVPPSSPEACRWCILGAISKVHPLNYWKARMLVARVVGCNPGNLELWNDRVDHATMLAAVRKAGV